VKTKTKYSCRFVSCTGASEPRTKRKRGKEKEEHEGGEAPNKGEPLYTSFTEGKTTFVELSPDGYNDFTPLMSQVEGVVRKVPEDHKTGNLNLNDKQKRLKVGKKVHRKWGALRRNN